MSGIPGETWAFDLDGCLVGVLAPNELRPLAREVLERFRASGITVVLWSAGGAAYARRIAERVGIADLVGAYYDKVRGPDGKWTLVGFPTQHRPVVCVDDEPGGVPDHVRSLAVPPYLGRRPHDRGLERILEGLEKERA